MMELATYQGSRSTFLSLPSFWSEGRRLKHFAPTLHAVGRKDRLISLRCKSCSSVGTFPVLGPKTKLFKISAFKGSGQRDDSGSPTNGAASRKNPVKVSYLQHKGEESTLESPKVQNIVPAPYTSADEATTRTYAVQNLFKHWLLLLRTPPRTESVDEVLEEPSSEQTSDVPNMVQNQEKSAILKSVWCYFMGLDAAIKIPLVLLMPLYLAVNTVYGSEVSKELTPLWIIGPLVIALYVKMFRSICALYVFSFKQTVKVVKNLPVYFLLVCDYIFKGKLKEVIWRHTWKPVEDVINMDYGEAFRTKMKDIKGWLVEWYLDYTESIWPSYCRMIRFLKRANLI